MPGNGRGGAVPLAFRDSVHNPPQDEGPERAKTRAQQDGEGDDAPYRRKALQLNFYRPGDTMRQTEDLIRFGVPAFEDEREQAYILQQYGLDERLDYQWLFR